MVRYIQSKDRPTEVNVRTGTGNGSNADFTVTQNWTVDNDVPVSSSLNRKLIPLSDSIVNQVIDCKIETTECLAFEPNKFYRNVQFFLEWLY